MSHLSLRILILCLGLAPTSFSYANEPKPGEELADGSVVPEGVGEEEFTAPAPVESSASDKPVTPSQPRKPSFVERNMGNSFFRAAQTTDQISCAPADAECENRKRRIAKQQAIMGHVGAATTVAAGVGVAAYAYGQFGMKKPDGKNVESDRDAMEKLANVQSMASKAMMGAGAVDVGMGVVTRTAVQGQFGGFEGEGNVEEAKAANKAAGRNAILWGAGKIGVGYLMHRQAENIREDAKNLESVTPDGASSSNGQNAMANPATQIQYQGFINGGVNSNAPIFQPTTSGSSSIAMNSSGASVAGAEMVLAEEGKDTSGASRATGEGSLQEAGVTATPNRSASVTAISPDFSISSGTPKGLGERSPASNAVPQADPSQVLFSDASAVLKAALADKPGQSKSLEGISPQNDSSLFEITSKQLRSAARTRLR